MHRRTLLNNPLRCPITDLPGIAAVSPCQPCSSIAWGCAPTAGEPDPGTEKATCGADGACTCTDGYVTHRCDVKSGNLRATACSGHGNGAIDSTSVGPNSQTVTCTCDAGFASADCSVACDGGTTTCSSHGTCADGASSDGSCACDDGYYAADCSEVCPGGSGSNQCSGHGTCGDGRSGTGQCSCDGGYATDDCSVECPGA